MPTFRGSVESPVELGISHVAVGPVVQGDRRGRELGFPTANVFSDQFETLHDGVYGGYAERPSGERYLAAISIGGRETFYPSGGPRLLEAHLLDFGGDLYGEVLRIELWVHLRAQQRFSSIAALIEQMRLDVLAVRELMAQWQTLSAPTV